MEHIQEFLREASITPWTLIEVGDIEGASDKGCWNANHVYIDCSTPFLIAATSLNLSTGDEVFGVMVTANHQTVAGFRKGPHFPYNKPQALQLDQLFDDGVSAFLAEPKEVHFVRDTVVDAGVVQALVPIERCITFSSSNAVLQVCASKSTPMAVTIRFERTKRKGKLGSD